jgi:uncharacterized membrane protein YphA (DoxX/SURF4 family)
MIVLDWTYKLTRWVLGAVFIYSGILKLLEPEAFAVLIEAYGIVPDPLLLPAAFSLAFLEVAAGVGLLLDVRGSLSVIAGLLVLFVTILAYGLWMGLDIDCGCFGSDDPEAEAFHGLKAAFYRDLLMLALVVFIFRWRRIRRIKPVNLFRFKIKKWIQNRKEDVYV